MLYIAFEVESRWELEHNNPALALALAPREAHALPPPPPPPARVRVNPPCDIISAISDRRSQITVTARACSELSAIFYPHCWLTARACSELSAIFYPHCWRHTWRTTHHTHSRSRSRISTSGISYQPQHSLGGARARAQRVSLCKLHL